MTLMTEPVSSLQDDNRKQLGAFYVRAGKVSIRSVWVYREVDGDARRACAVKRSPCWPMSA